MFSPFLAFLLFFSFSLKAVENQTSADSEWNDYYQNTLNLKNPHETAKLALQYFEEDGVAPDLVVDLGAGTGRDTRYALKNGWRVLAIDAEELAMQILQNSVEVEQLTNLEVSLSLFSDMVLPDQILWVNASYSLPFCELEDFPSCWQNIVDHLAIGGRFSGQLFGDKDEWVSNPGTFLTQEQMLDLFNENFEIEYLDEEEGFSMISGAVKYWHVYHVIAKKIK